MQKNLNNNEGLVELIRYSYKSLTGKTNSRIKLPSDISFYLPKSPQGELTIKLSKKGVLGNMQSDESAFEGWSFIVRRWTEYKNIKLEWEKVDNIENQHYQRFLYRAYKMLDNYSWFSISDSEQKEIKENCKVFHTNALILNVPVNKALEKGKIDSFSAKMRENDMEVFIFQNDEPLTNRFLLNSLYRQLPVGLFKDKKSNTNRIFTGGRSCIDLWGLNKKDKAVCLFELKNFRNIKVGILSELFFYSMIIADTMGIKRRITFNSKIKDLPGRCSLEDLNSIANYSVVSAIILSPRLHPLIDNSVFNLINSVKKKSAEIQINYKYAKLTENENNYKVD